MPDATITSTASTFGTISGTFAADQSTITGTVTGTVTGTLSGSVGVPGPQGPTGATGATGATGPAGSPGVGVPVGGTAGQYLTKTTTGVDYATGWTTLSLTGYATESWVSSQGYITTAILDDYALLSGASFSGFCDFINGLSSSGPVTLLDNGYLDASGLDGDSRRRIRFGAGNGGGSWGRGDFGFDGSNVLFGNDENLPETLATRSWVTAGFAPKASPVFTGNPTAPTPTFGDNDTSISTTAFVQAALAGGTAVAKNLEVEVRNQSGSTIPAGSIVYISGATGNKPLITLAQANNDANSAQTMGFTKTAIANNAFGYVIVRGEVENLDTSALTEGAQLYLSPTVAGAYTTTKPSAPQHLVYVGIVVRPHPTLGTILVAVQNGYELHELHDVALSSEANNDLLAYESSTDLWKNKTAATLGLAAINSQAFTGTPSLPTGTTGVTQTAGNNTTALATTAFVTAAVPAFATSTQSRAATSTTVAQSPGSDMWQMMNPGFIPILRNTLTYGATGTMGSAAIGNYTSRMTMGTVGAASANFRTFGASQIDQSWICVSKGYRSYIDFSRVTWCSGRFYTDDTWTDPQVSAGFYFGKANNSANGNLARKGFGWRINGNATAGSRTALLQVHDGTTLTNVSTSFALVAQQYFDWDVVSLGNGTVTLYINGTQVATTALGPTGDTSYSGTTPVIWNEEFVSTGTTSGYNATFSRGLLYIAP